MRSRRPSTSPSPRSRLPVALCAAACLLAAHPLHAQLLLNEICADNSSATSPGGTTPDFVELYNPGKSAVLLSGWSLSDDPAVPGKWAFPANASIASQGHLVVWLDASGGYAGLVATNFALRTSGEQLILARNLLTIDSLQFGPQIKNLSLGRYPSGATNWTLGPLTPGATNQRVALGSPTPLRINELLATNSTGDDWLELHNPPTNGPVALGGMVIADTDQVATVPAIWPNSFIGSGGFLRLDCSGSTSRGDRLDFKLSSTSSETVRLYAADRLTLLDQVSFGPQYRDISYGRLPDGGPQWFQFAPAGRATPGSANDWLPLTNVVVNEVLTHTDPPLEDAVELLNLTDQPVDISHWWLSNNREQPLKFQFPAGTIVPAHGYTVVFEQVGTSTPGFNRSGTGDSPDFTFNSAHGDDVVLTAGTGSGVTGARSARNVPAAANGVALTRHVKSTGGTDLVPESRRTFGTDLPLTLAQFRQSAGLTNAAPLAAPLVISEIMFHPPETVSAGATNDNVLDEFVELTCVAAAPLALYDASYPSNTWHLAGGISFQFPPNLTLAPQSILLLVNFNPQTNAAQLAAFRALYQVDPAVPVLGPYGGKLGNTSDSLELYRPDPPQLPPHPDAGYVPSILVEKVNYDLADGWPTNASGASLQRWALESYGNDPAVWLCGPPTAGRTLAATAPPIVRLQWKPGTGTQLQVGATTSPAFDVLGSSNLTDWVVVTHLTQSPGTNWIADPAASALPARFYRSRTSQP